MKKPTKYVNLFEQHSNKELLNEFIDKTNEYNSVYGNRFDKIIDSDLEVVDNDTFKSLIISHTQNGYDYGIISFGNNPDLKEMSDGIVYGYDELVTYNVTELHIHDNPNLETIMDLNVYMNSDDPNTDGSTDITTDILIHDNPVLRRIKIDSETSSERLFIENNPSLIDIGILNGYNKVTIKDCPLLFLATILIDEKDFQSSSLFKGKTIFDYDNHSTSIDYKMLNLWGDDENIVKYKKIAYREILNVTDFHDEKYIPVVPKILKCFIGTEHIDSVVEHMIKYGIFEIKDKLNTSVFDDSRYEHYKHLYHPDYKNTSVRDVAKFNTGQIYGIF